MNSGRFSTFFQKPYSSAGGELIVDAQNVASEQLATEHQTVQLVWQREHVFAVVPTEGNQQVKPGSDR